MKRRGLPCDASFSLWRFCFSSFTGTARAEPQWLTLPPTPTLPTRGKSGYAPVNGIKIWYATFGQGAPVILLHGGLANSNYWGNLVRALAPHYRVIVMDSRGHGRSSRDARPYGYDLMAVRRCGADGLSENRQGGAGRLERRRHHRPRHRAAPSRSGSSKLFAFAANSDPSAVKDVEHDPVFSAFIARAREEYETALADAEGIRRVPQADRTKCGKTQPHWTADDLHGIKVPTWIVDADHDEAIKRENTLFMADNIPGSGLLIQPEVSHFSFLQDPAQFNGDVLHFLQHVQGK